MLETLDSALNSMVRGYGLESARRNPEADSKHGKEHLGSRKSETSIDQISDNHLFNTDFAVWT
jgi:hypothetical protein